MSDLATTNDELRESYIRWGEAHADDLDRTLSVSEVFGRTVQGEGPHAGRSCYFIRTGGCNLSCDFCDTPYSTGQHGIPLSTIPRRTVASVAEAIPQNQTVVLTGGEPLMHLKTPAMVALLHMLKAKGCEIHVETNGKIVPGPDTEHLFDHITVSPKLGVTMVNPNQTPTLEDWSPLAHKTIFKWVVTETDPQAVVDFMAERIAISEAKGIGLRSIWFMPEGTSAEVLQSRWELVAQSAADLGANASHRLHVLAWGDTMGH